MTTLLESGARPFGSTRGTIISGVIHAALIGAAIYGTSRAVLPPREKVEEHPILYVAAPPPPPLPAAPDPLPKVAAPKPRTAPKAAPAPRRPAPPRPRPAARPAPAQVAAPKVPSTPALVAPTRVALSIPAPDLSAAPTLTDVVAPVVSEPAARAGPPTSGTVRSSSAGDVDPSGGRGLSSGSSGRAFDENQVDRAVEVTRAGATRYPDALRSVNVEGSVQMRFIVSADGRVEPGSIEVIGSTHPLFTQSVRTALLATRYRPAEAGGRKVRQLVEQSFSFKLDR